MPSIIDYLQTSELGPHANEQMMPPWLVRLLESDGELKLLGRISPRGRIEKVIMSNHVTGIMPVLEQLLTQDRSTEYAYLCHPSVKHISKLKREGRYTQHPCTKYLLTGLKVASVAIEIFKCWLLTLLRLSPKITNFSMAKFPRSSIFKIA
jgi:hypothetical protein